MLEKVNYPQDIKNLSFDDLEVLAEEIRKYIIEHVSRQGGHLASSLGAVELCIALHYCLDTPRDSVIFDVGHQTYAHKILTGRKNSFDRLRQFGGLSGFPNPAESEYDIYISGHASTAISWAQGLSEAKKVKGDTTRTVAVIGDGSLSGGMCLEALNHCGHRQTDLLVILNHNEMSISPSVGALNRYLTRIISLPVYNRIKEEIEVFLSHMPRLAKRMASAAKKFEESIKGMIVPGLFFEELGFRYFGPIDGHNLKVLIPILNNVLSLKGPRLLHIITKKGKGYPAAETDAESFHSASPFSVTTGEFVKGSSDTFGQVFARKLSSLARDDTRIVAITAAMAKGTGLDIFHKSFPDRFFDVGIAEEHAVGFASGLAKGGMRPFVAIYSTFLQRAFDQIIHDVALQNIPVTFCIDRAGFVGEDGPTHHGVFDIGYLRLIPNMVCMAPKDGEELEDMLEFALTLDSPASIRYPRGKSYSLGHRTKIERGKAEVLREGGDLCIIAVGAMVKEALGAVEYLQSRGIDASLVNARFIKPLDKDLLRQLSRAFRYIFTVEEGVITGGFGSGVAEFYQEEGVLDKVSLHIFAIPDEFSTFARREELLKMYKLDSASLAKRIEVYFKEKITSQR